MLTSQIEYVCHVWHAGFLGFAFFGCNFSIQASTPVDSTPPDMTGDVPIQRVTAGLQGFWKFDEGAGSVVTSECAPTCARMNLTIETPGAVAWTEGGLRISAKTGLTTPLSPDVNQAINNSGGVTIETWVTPANNTQGTDPPDAPNAADYAAVFLTTGNVVSYTSMIAQVGDKWIARTRTASTPGSEATPQIASLPNTAVAGSVVHLVLVTDAATRKLYVDGTPYESTPTAVDTLRWVPDYALQLADRPTGDSDSYDRQWHGVYWLLAVYDRALSPAEVLQNYGDGHDCSDC